MSFSKKTIVTAFALFSLFFGAGNLILPPLLGYQSGSAWWLTTLGFAVSAVAVPIAGILAHAKLQGTLFDFGKKVSPGFSILFSVIIYAISIALPSPRTASVVHEIAIAPLGFDSYLLTSCVYFGLVLIFALNRTKLLSVLGKILTPIIIITLLSIIGIAVFELPFEFRNTTFESPFTKGILEGYQTFDAIGAVVVGGVVIVSLQQSQKAGYKENKRLLYRGGWLAGLGLLIIYAGLICTGALMTPFLTDENTRIDILHTISTQTLGDAGTLLLSIVVSLACFTTALGIVTGTADFAKSRFPNVPYAYTVTAIFGAVFGVLVGQFNVSYIIAVALPVLIFIYPITILLIFLNIVPSKLASPRVFKIVIAVGFVFSIPDFLNTTRLSEVILPLQQWIPLSSYSLGWVLPSCIAFMLSNVIRTSKTTN